MPTTTIQFQAGLNSKAASHANALISRGAISSERTWSGPSATAENAYIEEEGWAAYGEWFLGVDREQNADTKAHYKYPFSSDFKTVSLNGLRAIRTRSAQNNETEIFDAAGRLMDKARAKVEAGSIRAWTFRQGPESVDIEQGRIRDVSIIEEGEARGHGMLITPLTLRGAAEKLLNKSLPAYITHANAQGDRLLSEVGIFSGFYLDGNRIRARNFTVLDSFRKFEREKYERLFEMAAMAPDNFGVSLVFEGKLMWETSEGDEEYLGMAQRPESALNQWPTVIMVDIQSADFVDSPAANRSLFSNPLLQDQPTKTMNTENNTLSDGAFDPVRDALETPEPVELEQVELNESASAELERRLAEENGDAAPKKEKADAKPKKKARKKKLEAGAENEVQDDDTTPDGDPIELAFAEYKTRVEERDRMLKDMGTDLDEAREEITRLKGLIAGTDPVIEDCAPQEIVQIDNAQLKEQLIGEYLDANTGATRSIAICEVYKQNKQLFETKTETQIN